MKLLEQRILRDGEVLPGGVLKVGSFLNHQLDVSLYEKMAVEWHRLFADDGVNKILTVEASGIGLACIAARNFGCCPVVFAKKSKTSNVDGSNLLSAQVHSFTHGNDYTMVVERRYLSPADRVLLIDDFLANGEALRGLMKIVRASGATLVGAGIAIEKAFQPGGADLRAEGLRIESLARIKSMADGSIVFC